MDADSGYWFHCFYSFAKLVHKYLNLVKRKDILTLYFYVYFYFLLLLLLYETPLCVVIYRS